MKLKAGCLFEINKSDKLLGRLIEKKERSDTLQILE